MTADLNIKRPGGETVAVATNGQERAVRAAALNAAHEQEIARQVALAQRGQVPTIPTGGPERALRAAAALQRQKLGQT